MRQRRTLHLVNRRERSSVWAHRNGCAEKAFILWFGAYGYTRLLVYARHLEDALEECNGWIEDNAPGLYADDAVTEAYNEALERLRTEETDADEDSLVELAQEEAEGDVTSLDGGHYINSWEWGLVGEGLTPRQIADYVHGRD